MDEIVKETEPAKITEDSIYLDVTVMNNGAEDFLRLLSKAIFEEFLIKAEKHTNNPMGSLAGCISNDNYPDNGMINIPRARRYFQGKRLDLFGIQNSLMMPNYILIIENNFLSLVDEYNKNKRKENLKEVKKSSSIVWYFTANFMSLFIFMIALGDLFSSPRSMFIWYTPICFLLFNAMAALLVYKDVADTKAIRTQTKYKNKSYEEMWED